MASKASNTASAPTAPEFHDTVSTTIAEERASTSWAVHSPDPKPGNDLYTVFPKEGADLPQTIDFIKGTIGAEDLLPWTDVQEHLKHWTVEASPDEVSKLQAHAGIDKVSKLQLPQAPADAATHVSRQAQAAQDEQYGIFPVNGEDHQQNSATDKALKDMLGKRVRDPFVSPITGELVFWTATLNAGEAAKVKGTPGVGAVEVDETLELDFAIPETRASFPHVHQDKRDIAYKKQPDAVTELVAISQPSTIPDIKDLKDYVYESHNGEGTFVYHIEFGVAFKAQKDEFAHVADEHILTKLAKDSNKKPEDDEASDPFDSHGTCTAGKAVGQKYGASKKATLVVVKLGRLKFFEMIEAIELVAADIASKPARRKKSVVTMSFGVALDEKLHAPSINKLKARIEGLFKVDVPVVVTSGNNGRKPGRAEVDRYPALLAGPDMPLIVVGAIDRDGKKLAWSQGGPRVTIHAVGNQSTCLPKDGKEPMVRDGTSVAAPLVAGEIANLLSYETVPFDTSDGNVAKNALAYLQSGKASWARVPGIPALWNGVTERDNPKAGGQSALPPPPPPPPEDKLTCNGLKDGKYVSWDTLKDLIENKFCPEAVKQGGLDKDSGSIMRPYYDNTLEGVHLAIDFRPGLDYKPTMEDCVKSLMSLVDNCDGNDPANNPQNYKGGGRLQRGEVTFRVGPTANRAPAKLGKTAGCDSTYKFAFNEYWVWGHGFVSSDWGNALKNHVSGCALLPGTWSFEYGIGNDGREWTARFRTGVFQKKCVGNAIKSVSGIGDFGCNGSG